MNNICSFKLKTFVIAKRGKTFVETFVQQIFFGLWFIIFQQLLSRGGASAKFGKVVAIKGKMYAVTGVMGVTGIFVLLPWTIFVSF